MSGAGQLVAMDSRHIGEEDLLKYADGELSPRTEREVRRHLSSCWECRSELESIEQTAAQCARYRKLIREDCLFPSPPAPWRDIRPDLRGLNATLGSRSVFVRAGDTLRSWFDNPLKWAPATVGALVLLAAALYQFHGTPAVEASELLQKAMAAEQQRSADDAGALPARRLRIHTASFTVSRAAGAGWERDASGQGPTSQVAGWFKAARYDFDDPLSVRSYVHWRAALATRRDRVEVVADGARPSTGFYRVQTSTPDGALEVAALRLRRSNLEPLDARFDFRNHQRVDIEPESPPPPASAVSPSTPARPAPRPPEVPPPSAGIVAPRPATAAEEVEVFAALHRLGADLGEPVEVTRDEQGVHVTGYGLGGPRKQELEAALGALPGVSLSFAAAGAGPRDSSPAHPAATVSASPDNAALQASVEQKLGGHATFEQISTEAFDLNDAVMARAHALRRLAERFPVDVEASLPPTQRAVLASLVREHAEALAVAAERLARRMTPVFSALDTPTGSTAAGGLGRPWQTAARRLFNNARQAEVLLAVMLGGAASDIPADQVSPRLAASISQLRASAEEYRSLAAE
jgi:hypothetical protein